MRLRSERAWAFEAPLSGMLDLMRCDVLSIDFSRLNDGKVGGP